MDPGGHKTTSIKPIQKKENLYTTFSKRRQGLFNKASEFCTDFGADIGIIVYSPTDTPHSFFSPSMDSVIERYQNLDCQLTVYEQVDDIFVHETLKKMKQKQGELRAQLSAELERGKKLDEEEKKARADGKYNDFNVVQMDKEELAKRKVLFERVREETATRMEKLQPGKGSSSMNEN